MNKELESIIAAELPAFRGNIRNLTRKEWAVNVRRLFKDLKLTGISVTTPSYSMASTIHIQIPSEGFDADHENLHREIDERERTSASWLGYGNYCPICKYQWQAHTKTEAIILAAFPDLNDRGDSQSDYYNRCISVS